MTDKDFLRREKTLRRDEVRTAVASAAENKAVKMMTLEEYEHACQRLKKCELRLKYLYADLAETEGILRDARKRKANILSLIRFVESSCDWLAAQIDSQQ